MIVWWNCFNSKWPFPLLLHKWLIKQRHLLLPICFSYFCCVLHILYSMLLFVFCPEALKTTRVLLAILQLSRFVCSCSKFHWHLTGEDKKEIVYCVLHWITNLKESHSSLCCYKGQFLWSIDPPCFSSLSQVQQLEVGNFFLLTTRG